MTDEAITIPGSWNIDYDYSAGETASHFLASIRDHEQLVGKRCPECERVLVPPRAFCERCFVDTDEWVDVGPEGQVESFTVIPHDLGAGPEAPFALAYVQLDDADTSVVNVVEGVDAADPEGAAEDLAIGTRLEAVFEDDREGRITDFHFEPVE